MHALGTSDFHKVELQHHRDSSSCMNASSRDSFSFQLKGPIRQISAVSLLNDCCVAVRSDRLCGVWRFSERDKPHLLEVVNTREVATCISVSPHVLGEVLVASESGAANLWTVGRGMLKIREEDDNLYFNAKSSWRWCEFSAHPRVMLYADRTGVELTDIRVSPLSSHTLFRISNTPECRSGERLILSRYLGDVHSFQHLITTQYSAYIMDERFPCIPMLKWDHLMDSPPMFCHTIGGSDSAVGGARTTKVLLGSHRSQEITLLQYSGGRAEACSSRGPPQALLRPKDSLKHLSVQIPHRMDLATNRLSSPAAGLTCIWKRGGKAGGEECICVLQLTEAGDIFYQILEHEQPDASGPPAAEDEPPPQPALREDTTSGRKTAKRSQSLPQLVIPDTSSDEDVIGPTQSLSVARFVAETPEKEQQTLNVNSDSEESESGGRGRYMKQLRLQVVVNDDPELDRESVIDAGAKDGEVGKGDGAEEPGGVEETASSFGRSEQQAAVKLRDATLIKWKHWLQKLMERSREKKLCPHQPQHLTVETEHLLYDDVRDRTEEERVQSLRRDLRACMSKRSLLVHSAISTSLEAPDLIMVPDVVDTDLWKDQISHRLTLSWQGEKAWRTWWEDHLGLNREEKVAALKRKRKREKEAKRATARRLELCGSFTSSVSYQSQLGDFSDSMGWSSGASQGAWSDGEDKLTQLEDCLESGTPTAATPSATQIDTPAPTPTPTPQSVKHKPADQQTPSSSRTLTPSQTPKPDATPASQRRIKRPAKNYLSSLFAPQDEPSQHGSYILEEGSTVRSPPPPVASSSQRSIRVDLSQDASVSSGFSQSLPLSQSSQRRPGLSQASQPKKKKSRMGF